MLHWVSVGPNVTRKQRSILSLPAHILNEGSVTSLLVYLIYSYLLNTFHSGLQRMNTSIKRDKENNPNPWLHNIFLAVSHIKQSPELNSSTLGFWQKE